ncbi:hypothetical protein [Streptomyces avicenniae]|uniref:hypothetical protein n=1 Tax=Streptomyces avicenniae TaxID=500153 RepID=UPI00069AAAA2|nr:hypothetical protein [Streptomyces avicenniae]
MPDLSMDYSQLYAVQQRLHDLAERAGTGGATGLFAEMGAAGQADNRAILGNSTLAARFDYFYRVSKRRTDQAKDGLESLGDTFEGVANLFFQSDAQIAAGSGVMGGSIGLNEWREQRAAYDRWVEDSAAWDAYLDEIGAADYFDANPDAQIGEVCSAADAPGWCETWFADEEAPPEPGPAPPKPSDDPPTSLHYEDGGGSVDVELTLDENNEVLKETSTITTPEGQTFTTVREYSGPPEMVDPPGDADPYDVRDWTVTTTAPDGSTTVERVVIEQDGSGTMTITSDDEVTEYTRPGPGAEWDEKK